jgi:hypothetical protein
MNPKTIQLERQLGCLGSYWTTRAKYKAGSEEIGVSKDEGIYLAVNARSSIECITLYSKETKNIYGIKSNRMNENADRMNNSSKE